MASSTSKDIAGAKKLSAGIRQFHKELLDHLYAQAAEAGRYPSPERMIFDQLLPLVKVAILAGRPLDLRAAQRAMLLAQDVTDLEAMLGIRLYKQLWHDAVDAYFRHRPELKIKKGKPGRKPNVELAERIWALHDARKTSRAIQQILAAEGVNLTLEAIEAYLKTRRKKPQQ